MASIGAWAHKIWIEPWQELAEEVKEVPVQDIFVKPWVEIAADVGIVEDKGATAGSQGQDKTSSEDATVGVSSSSSVGKALDDIFSGLGSRNKEEEADYLADREHYTKRKAAKVSESPSEHMHEENGEDGDDEEDAPVFASTEVDDGRGRPSTRKALLFRVLDSIGLRGLNSGLTGQKAVVWEDGSEDRLPAFPKPTKMASYTVLIALFFIGTLVVYLVGAQLGWGVDTQLDGAHMQFGQAQNGEDSTPTPPGNETVGRDGGRGGKQRHHDPRHMNKDKKHPFVPVVAPRYSTVGKQKRRHHEPKPKVDALKGLRPHTDDYEEDPDDHPANRMGRPPDS
mmetsp:Transcript_3624/g.7539  ORF Transcript_3624/g.7539 Transcript_3624/m.7539 type:complete len:339 (-) Transcript_3624:49-1065(-)